MGQLRPPSGRRGTRVAAWGVGLRRRSCDRRAKELTVKISLGYIGAGEWGVKKHIAAIEYVRDVLGDTNVELTALCERDPARAKALAKKYHIKKLYHDLDEFARDPDINCFSVTVTPSSLVSVLPALARRNLPIFCEKPLGTSYAEAERFAAIVEACNVVGFNRRFYPIVTRFKEIIASLPPPVFVDASFFRHGRTDSLDHASDPTRREPPFVIGTAIHMINLLEYAIGPIRDVDVTELETGWFCRLQYERGRSARPVPGALTILPCCGKHTESIEYHTADVSVGLLCSLYGDLDYPGKIVLTKQGREQQIIDGSIDSPRIVNEGFVDEYREFFSLVRSGGTSRSDFRSAVNSMRIAEKIEKW
ncbi:MAG: gfo/Idh/MocA family oxidoreductase [Spirochaetaceae bacterium]|nr:MAG: gfo/Idh/MocA family oxidoreductase [Spirochaetaceae bacterium]